MTTAVLTSEGARTSAGPVPMALGTMYFGTTVPRDTAVACLDRAHELGATFWDTANNYAFWAGGTGDESETVLGSWFAARGSASRDAVVVATKIGARPAPAGGGAPTGVGLSAPAVREQTLHSLRRLQTDRIDVLYAHVDDREVPFAETLGALSELVDEGLVRELAASNLEPRRLREAVAVGRAVGRGYQALQQRFTYLVPDPTTDLSPHVLLDDEVERTCTAEGLMMLGYSPLLSGAYTRPDRELPEGYTTSVTRGALATLAEVASEADLDEGQTVLAWMAQRDVPVLPVVGVSSPGQVESAWNAVTTALAPDALVLLDEARRGR